MDGIESILNPAAAASLQSKNDSLTGDTEERFLTLLVTQLQNQDPLNPMENAEVTSQIAQLSTVTGIQQLNNTLLALSGQMDMSQSLQASGLIGKDILYPGDKVALGSNPEDPDQKSVTPFGIDLMAPASKVTLSIMNRSGKPVYTQELGAMSAGVYPMNWDGTDDTGVPLDDGAYYVQLSALNDKGRPVPAEALTFGHVNSVAYTTDGLRLNLSKGEKISLMDIRQLM